MSKVRKAVTLTVTHLFFFHCYLKKERERKINYEIQTHVSSTSRTEMQTWKKTQTAQTAFVGNFQNLGKYWEKIIVHIVFDIFCGKQIQLPDWFSHLEFIFSLNFALFWGNILISHFGEVLWIPIKEKVPKRFVFSH